MSVLSTENQAPRDHRRGGNARNRALHDQGQKQPRTKIYGKEPPFLFVPLERMWIVRNAAKECRQREGKVIIAGIARILEERIHNIEATIAHWRKLYGADDRSKGWFNDWLLEDNEAPRTVRVATLDMVRRCRKAWDFLAHCRSAKIRATSYYRWLKTGLIPDWDWLLWLYGSRPPAGTFVVGPELQRLRKEKTQDRILARAVIGKTTLGRWKAHAGWDAALTEALRVAAEGGGLAELANRCAPWKGLKPRAQKCMWRYAQAATLAACCAAAGFDNTKHYFNLMTDAKRKGVKAALDRYLNGEEWLTDGRNFRAGRLVAGPIAPNLFVPTGVLERADRNQEPGGMFAFRRIARAAMTEQNIWALTDLPHFFDWFRDWVVPWEKQGQRIALPRSFDGDGLPLAAVEDTSRGRNGHGAEAEAPDHEGVKGGQADEARPSEASGNGQPAGLPSSPEKGNGNRSGRPRSKTTEEVYRFCYEEYITKGRSRLLVLREAQGRFKEDAPKSEAVVAIYARRYAERFSPPLTLQRGLSE